jgi:hypothetical protein
MQAEKEYAPECPFCNCMETYPLVKILDVVTWCCMRCACTFVPAQLPNKECEAEAG